MQHFKVQLLSCLATTLTKRLGLRVMCALDSQFKPEDDQCGEMAKLFFEYWAIDNEKFPNSINNLAK